MKSSDRGRTGRQREAHEGGQVARPHTTRTESPGHAESSQGEIGESLAQGPKGELPPPASPNECPLTFLTAIAPVEPGSEPSRKTLECGWNCILPDFAVHVLQALVLLCVQDVFPGGEIGVRLQQLPGLAVHQKTQCCKSLGRDGGCP